MALEEKDVRYVAELAHLEVSPEEVKKFLPQLDSILEHMQKLNELDTSEVEPMAQVTYPSAVNPSLRADLPHKMFEQAEALANAPDPSAGYFRVPRVIEKEE